MRYFTFIAVLCLAAGALVPPAYAAGGVKLEYKFREGEVLRYKVESDAEVTVNIPGLMQLPPIPVKMSAVLVQKTGTVLDDGAADILAGAESFKLEMNGSAQDIPKEQVPVLMLSVARNGEIRSLKGLENASPTIPGIQLAVLSALCRFGGFPEGEISTGDSWKASFPFPMAKGSLSVASRLESLAEEGRRAGYSQAASGDIELALPFGMDPGSLKAKTVKGPVQCLGAVIFSSVPGRIAKSEGVVDMKFSMPEYASAGASGDSTVKIRYKIELLP